MNHIDTESMQLALKLAQKALKNSSPNPAVGAVIVKNNKIIGTGYTQPVGFEHAEIVAIKNSGKNSANATLYVTMEPCCHTNKRTPPCIDAIIKSKIKRVVVAMHDPNPEVCRKGTRKLAGAGIKVETGFRKKEAIEINEWFIKFMKEKLPYVIIKSAMTLDGKIAVTTGKSRWISSPKTREWTSNLRNTIDGILVGINTVIADNPHLTAPRKSIYRIILDTACRIPLGSNIIKEKDPEKVIIATSKLAPAKKLKALKKMGIKTIISPLRNKRVDLKFTLKKLAEIGIARLLVEGGGEVNSSFIFEGLADKVIFIIAPKIFGGRDSKTPVEGKGIGLPEKCVGIEDISVTKIDHDIIVEGYLKRYYI